MHCFDNVNKSIIFYHYIIKYLYTKHWWKNKLKFELHEIKILSIFIFISTLKYHADIFFYWFFNLWNYLLVYGPALLEHTILSVGLKPTAKVPQQFDVNDSDGKFKQVKNLLHRLFIIFYVHFFFNFSQIRYNT